MIRSFKYRLHPSQKQEAVLVSWLVQCGQLYNAALEQRTSAWKQSRKNVSYYDQQKQLADLRQSDESWWSVPVLVQRSALVRLNLAFESFFRRCKSGEEPGYPRFRSAKSYSSFTISTATLTKDRVHIPKLGHVKLNLHRPLKGEIKDVKFKKDKTNKWWVSFCCDVGEAPVKTPVITETGIDLGLTSFVTLANGEKIGNPRFYKKSQDKLAEQQRVLSRRECSSKSRERQRILVAKTSQHIQNQRLDYARKLAVELYSKYDLIGYENLNVKGMIQGRLSKSIHDASWTTFINCLTLKAENAGKFAIPVNPKGTSQRCSGCEAIVPKQLSDRTHDCPHCGLALDRDHNAALNILKLARLGLGEHSDVLPETF